MNHSTNLVLPVAPSAFPAIVCAGFRAEDGRGFSERLKIMNTESDISRPIFQLLTPENLHARTITTARAALDFITKSPDGWTLEEFDQNLVSKGIIRKGDVAAMGRLRLMVSSF